MSGHVLAMSAAIDMGDGAGLARPLLLPARPPRPKKPPALTLSRLIRQSYPERWLLLLASVALVISTATSLALPVFIGHVVDELVRMSRGLTTPDEARVAVNAYVLELVCVVSLGGVFAFLRGYLFSLSGERIVARIRKRLFARCIAQEIGMFDMMRTGELVSRLASDTSILNNAITSNLSKGLTMLSTVSLGLVYLFRLSVRLSLLMISVIPAVAIIGRLYGRYVRTLSRQTQDALARATEVADESFSNIRTVRAFSNETLRADLYNEKIEDTYNLGARVARLLGYFVGFMATIAPLSTVFIMWSGAMLVIQRELTVGLLTSFLLLTVSVGKSLAGISGLISNVYKALGANAKVFELIDRAEQIRLTGGLRPAVFTGDIRMVDVSFTYPARPDTPVLNGLNIVFESGKVTALVGPSGGGKSTIFAMIERFYDPSQGVVTLDGEDIRNLDVTWMHRRIGLVSQEPVLFAGSIRDNIAFGKADASMESIIAAASAANAHDFVMAFEHGYDTLVGERGLHLSGGQKQRIAIARAVLLNPKVLLLDEATSSLDAESEFVVQDALDKLMKGRTVVVIAHRLSTVKDADLVVVIDRGRVVESGTHDALLARDGMYAHLVRRQLQ
ncbi:unnamed protein product (mitochondrion) [Plasmodiophora brassicae]|uniref:Uncharacterized protein n=1 Tax=Plasmodiophora brassicae TaxID=37360 RepID=A0A0G4IPX0_PLABS|nr:hypothetical protein PBRA_000590 [Plasmodiophora brassicae]SPQ97553.1 unnamed protein product [Plasmodiophora brassicae]